MRQVAPVSSVLASGQATPDNVNVDVDVEGPAPDNVNAPVGAPVTVGDPARSPSPADSRLCGCSVPCRQADECVKWVPDTVGATRPTAASAHLFPAQRPVTGNEGFAAATGLASSIAVVGERYELILSERARCGTYVEFAVWPDGSDLRLDPPEVIHCGPLDKIAPTLRRHGLLASDIVRAGVACGLPSRKVSEAAVTMVRAGRA